MLMTGRPTSLYLQKGSAQWCSDCQYGASLKQQVGAYGITGLLTVFGHFLPLMEGGDWHSALLV